LGKTATVEGDRRALVVEDDADIRALLVELLAQSGFDVVEAGDGATALRRVAEHDPDLVTLDLNLPDFDGIEVCRRIRQSSDAYVVMLTARPDEIDRLIGLETGADDYLTKPFSPRELKARVAAMMRRPRRDARADAVNGAIAAAAEPPPPPIDDDLEVLRHADLEVDVDGRVAKLGGVELDLTRTEFDLLVALLRGPRRVYSRETLLRTVWGSEWFSDTHLVEVHMGNLRRKLGDDPKRGRYVRTVRGVGYRLGSGE
jgi:DNA-binding response OmpR family regulator